MFIPLPYYTPIFFNVLLILAFFSFLRLNTKGVSYNQKNYTTIGFFICLVFYMGLRPINGFYFGDMSTYNKTFEAYQSGAEIRLEKDYFWGVFMKFCSTIMSAKSFFLLCSFLYLAPVFIACKNWFKGYSYIPFLMLVGSFSFWVYGTNGIRNGIATSLILLGLSLQKNKIFKYSIITAAFLFHASVIIPIGAYIIAIFVKKSKLFFFAWLIAIPLSLILGSFWENFFASLGFADERISYLTDGNINGDKFAYTGFRWDFVMYSFSGIYAAYYFIVKKGFEDKIYNSLFATYAISNAFWILVIRSNFSNRFAYLSWFMLAIVIFYPFFKQNFFRNQPRVLSKVMILYFWFSYLMNVILV